MPLKSALWGSKASVTPRASSVERNDRLVLVLNLGRFRTVE